MHVQTTQHHSSWLEFPTTVEFQPKHHRTAAETGNMDKYSSSSAKVVYISNEKYDHMVICKHLCLLSSLLCISHIPFHCHSTLPLTAAPPPPQRMSLTSCYLFLHHQWQSREFWKKETRITLVI